MADLKVKVAGVEFNNPLIAASGTFGFGREYSEFYPLSVMGGISCKGITLKARPGNPAPRIAETPCEIVVANATPATLRSIAVTKITLSPTFIKPAIVKKIKGDFVSPAARRMAAQKL